MKKMMVLLALTGIMAATACNREKRVAGKGEFQGSISISGAFALYPMVSKWSEEFSKIHPDVRFDVSAGGAGKGMADVLAGLVDIGMVSREIQPAEAARGAWWVPVAKDGVVAVANEKNPFTGAIRRMGIKRERFHDIWVQGSITCWEDLLLQKKTGKGSAINVYTRSDSCGAAETWAMFFGKKQEDLKGIGVNADPGLAEAVKRDTLGIGYNNINFAYDPDTRRPISGLQVLPIDLNGNGILDAGENFYETRDMLVQAVSDGRYPSPPSRDLYFVCKGKPANRLLRRFVSWVLSEGQKFVTDSGYVSPAQQKIQAGLEKLQD